MEMAATFLIWFITLGSGLIFSSADPAKGCTHKAALGQRLELPLTLAKDARLRWRHNGTLKHDTRLSLNTLSVTKQGNLILPKVSSSDAGNYVVEVVNTAGATKSNSLVLCVLERVQKPIVNIECETNKVQFTCSVPQTKDIIYQWLQGVKIIDKENAAILVQTHKQTSTTSFTCKVSNGVSSESSDPVQPKCSKPDDEENLLFGLDFWLMIGILVGGGGLVFVLIVATIVCCTINRRKRKLRVKDEQEMRLQWSSANHQQHHYANQRGHAHSRDPAHSHDPAQSRDPSSRQTAATQGPAAAGHTGPRPPKSRQNRPRPPDPITGQPLPGPRRQAQTGKTQVPTIGNDEESPPPLPKPRKQAPRK